MNVETISLLKYLKMHRLFKRLVTDLWRRHMRENRIPSFAYYYRSSKLVNVCVMKQILALLF